MSQKEPIITVWVLIKPHLMTFVWNFSTWMIINHPSVLVKLLTWQSDSSSADFSVSTKDWTHEDLPSPPRAWPWEMPTFIGFNVIQDTEKCVSTENPNDHCFAWKRPCFGGLTFKNRGHLGSRYSKESKTNTLFMWARFPEIDVTIFEVIYFYGEAIRMIHSTQLVERITSSNKENKNLQGHSTSCKIIMSAILLLVQKSCDQTVGGW